MKNIVKINLVCLALTTLATSFMLLGCSNDPLDVQPPYWAKYSESDNNYCGTKFIALTFDDGPSYRNTEVSTQALNMLQRHGARATFYVIGDRMQDDNVERLIRRVADEGHEIGNHSWSHDRNLMNSHTLDGLRDEMLKTDARVGEILGIPDFKSPTYRQPFSDFTNPAIIEATESLGYPIIHFGQDSGDWIEENDWEHIADSIVAGAGQIVVIHINRMDSVRGTENAIVRLREQGYEFLTVSEILERTNTPPTPGEVISELRDPTPPYWATYSESDNDYCGTKFIALTFDDGPSYRNIGVSSQALDMLQRHGVRATFYVIGGRVVTHLIRRVADEGHEIGNHSWSHDRDLMNSHTVDGLRDEILKTDARVGEILGIPDFKSPTYRQPFSDFTNPAIIEAAESLGYPIIHFGQDSGDWIEETDWEHIADSIVAGSGQIVVIHINRMDSVRGTENAIVRLREKGYEFLTVSEILERTGTPATPGEIISELPD